MDKELEKPESKELFKLKRKWQIALRRYVLEKQLSPSYAKYFGLPIDLFREWIETQFDERITWENFGQKWQFEHIVPITYFNFNNENDLELCWSFINIRVEKLYLDKDACKTLNVLAAKAYFNEVYNKTGYYLCKQMLDKIHSIETAQLENNDVLQVFILKHQETLMQLKDFTEENFERANWGTAVSDIAFENQLLQKLK